MKEQFKLDFKKYLIWIFAAFIVVNFLPKILVLVFVIYLSYKYIKSNDEVVYFAVFISIIANLAGLFGEHFNGLISISLIEFNIISIFVFVNYIKYFVYYKQRKQIFHFQKPFIIYYTYFAFLIIVGFIYGIEETGKSGLRHYFQIVNVITLVPIFLVLPQQLKSNNFINRLSNLLFITVFINIAGQAFMLIFGVPISQYIKPDPSYGIIAGETNYMQEALRPILAAWLIILSLFLAFFSIVKKVNIFNLNFLYLVLFASFFSIFITATRGWILAFILFIMLSIFFMSTKVGIKVISSFIMGLVLFFILYSSSTLFKVQIDKSFERFSTLELIAEGDISAGGTNSRHLRGREVMKGYYKSPIIGLGFSSEGLRATDQHVGNQMILMSGGIIGYIVILYLLAKISLRSLHLNKFYLKNKISFKNYNGELKLIPVFLASLFLIHSTSTALFGYTVYIIAYGNMLWVAIYISLINRILNEYLNEQNSYSNYN